MARKMRMKNKYPRLAHCTHIAFLIAACALAVSCGSDGEGGGDGSTPALTNEQVRDLAIQRMRETDFLSQRIFSGNWSNGAYASWTRYLSNQITADAYQSLVAANPNSGYYPPDPYGFDLPSRTPPASPNYASIVNLSNPRCYFSSELYNSLAASYFSSGDPVYLNAWLNINHDMAVNERQAILQFSDAQLRASPAFGCIYPESGAAGALLNVANHVGQELFALAMLSKSLDLPPVSTPRPGWNTLPAPKTTALTSEQLSRVPANTLIETANGIATNYAPTLMKHYGAASDRVPNQWLSGLYGPALLSEFFTELPSVAALTPSVDAGISAILAATVHADGGMMEQSFNYTDGVADDFYRLSKFKPRSWTAAAQAAHEGYWRQAAAIATPQSGNPQMGNGEWNTQRRATGHTFSQTSIAFPYSGYYTQRSDWTANSPYLFFFSRRAANGHSMAGSNSIQMAANGRALIVAGGSTNYSASSASHPNSVPYLDERSTWKTSTIAVDGTSQKGGSTTGLQLNASGKPDIYHVAPSPIQSRWATSSTFDFLEGTYDADYGYDPYTKTTNAASGVVHKRMVTFVRDIKAWVVVDFLLPSNSNNHTYSQIWKLAPPVPQAQGSATQTAGFYPSQVNLPTGAAPYRIYTNDTTGGAVNLSIYQTSSRTLAYTQYYGSNPNSLYGFYSPTPLFSPDIHVDWSGTGNQVVITVLLPFTGSSADGVTSVTNATAGGIAGIDMVVNGKNIAVRASPVLAALAAANRNMSSGNLLLVESDAGANPRTLYIGDAAIGSASTINAGSTVTPVTIPTGFHWATDSSGNLTASYMP